MIEVLTSLLLMGMLLLIGADLLVTVIGAFIGIFRG